MKRKILRITVIIISLFVIYLIIRIITGYFSIGNYQKFHSKDLKGCLNIKNIESKYSGEIRCLKYRLCYNVGNHVRERNNPDKSLYYLDTLYNDYVRKIFIVENENLINLYIEKIPSEFDSDSTYYPYALNIISFDYSLEDRDELIRILKNIEPDF